MTERKPGPIEQQAIDTANVPNGGLKEPDANDLLDALQLDLLGLIHRSIVKAGPDDYVDVPTAQQAAHVYVTLFGAPQ